MSKIADTVIFAIFKAEKLHIEALSG